MHPGVDQAGGDARRQRDDPSGGSLEAPVRCTRFVPIRLPVPVPVYRVSARRNIPANYPALPLFHTYGNSCYNCGCPHTPVRDMQAFSCFHSDQAAAVKMRRRKSGGRISRTRRVPCRAVVRVHEDAVLACRQASLHPAANALQATSVGGRAYGIGINGTCADAPTERRKHVTRVLGLGRLLTKASYFVRYMVVSLREG